MIVALAVLAFFGNNLDLFTILLGFFGWERLARLACGLAMSASEQGHTIAVRDLGASPWRIYGLHILPNVASSLIVAMTLNLPEVILLERA
jgi:peptide/nickel transport system permease protein